MDNLPALKPEIKQGDLFLCDLADAALKDDMASMEHPVFTLSKKPDIKKRIYRHNGNTLTVTPSIEGLATIYDKDILIYATSKLMKAKNAGEPISRNIIFEAQECLRFIGRTNKGGIPGGNDYRRLEKALQRLSGTRLQTDIATGGITQTKMFGLVDTVTIHREGFDGRILEWGIELSKWVYNSILSNEVLTLHPDYFRLRRPIEKRIYELARRHCGNQPDWKISLDLLLKKSGARTIRKEFKRLIKGIVKHDHLPDYHICLDKDDFITFSPKDNSKLINNRKAKGTVSGGVTYTIDRLESLLDHQSISYTKYIAKDKNLDWYRLLSDFTQMVNSKKTSRKNMSASFVNYVMQQKNEPRY